MKLFTYVAKLTNEVVDQFLHHVGKPCLHAELDAVITWPEISFQDLLEMIYEWVAIEQESYTFPIYGGDCSKIGAKTTLFLLVCQGCLQDNQTQKPNMSYTADDQAWWLHLFSFFKNIFSNWFKYLLILPEMLRPCHFLWPVLKAKTMLLLPFVNY